MPQIGGGGYPKGGTHLTVKPFFMTVEAESLGRFQVNLLKVRERVLHEGSVSQVRGTVET